VKEPLPGLVDVSVKDRNLLGLVVNWKEFLQGEDSRGKKNWGRARKTGDICPVMYFASIRSILFDESGEID
jgi:hypothetical protein